MASLGLLSYILLLILNLWGGALIVGWGWRNRWLALAVAPWIWATLLFGMETQVGLGGLRWLAMVTTVISVALIHFCHSSAEPPSWSTKNLDRLRAWRLEFNLAQAWACPTVLVVIFGYAMLWRYGFPDVDGSAEKLADLAFICSYLPGDKIPVIDAWLYPYPSVHYYSFQHYAAALMGRLLGLSPGATYNLAFCALVGLTGFSFAGAVVQLTQRLWVRIVIVSAFVLGGTGASGFVHLFFVDPHPWNSMRFIGSPNYDAEPLGLLLKKYAERHAHLDLPGEPFAYSIYLGDYHPPLSGLCLIGLGVMGAALWEKTQKRRYAAVVGATLAWSVLANPWTLPLQGFWVAGWCLWNFRQWKPLWLSVAAGGAVVWLAGSAYLTAFSSASAEYQTNLRIVPWEMHTPPLMFILYLLPTLGLIALSLISGNKRALGLGAAAAAYVFLSEFVYIDDVYSGDFERFNTTLKWWPWIASAVLLVLAPVLLEQTRKRWLIVWAALFCLYPCTFAYDLGRFWLQSPKPSFGKFEGDQYLNLQEGAKLMLARMKLEPRGVVVERPNKDSYTNSACLPLLAGHRMWLGWVGHELLWHGYRSDVGQRQDRLLQFFAGDMKDATVWLRAENIDYVLWYQDPDTTELWTKINDQIGGTYVWCEVFSAPDGKKVGFWRRQTAPKSR